MRHWTAMAACLAVLALAGCAHGADDGAGAAIESLPRAKACNFRVIPATSGSDPHPASSEMTVKNDGGWCSVDVDYGNVVTSANVRQTPRHGELVTEKTGSSLRFAYRARPYFAGDDEFRIDVGIPGHHFLVDVDVTVGA